MKLSSVLNQLSHIHVYSYKNIASQRDYSLETYHKKLASMNMSNTAKVTSWHVVLAMIKNMRICANLIKNRANPAISHCSHLLLKM